MIQANVNSKVYGSRYEIVVLDKEERKLLDELEQCAGQVSDWGEYCNFYMKKVGGFYEARGLSRRQVMETPMWKIAQEILGRLQVAAGDAREDDYRDDLAMLIHTKFGSRRAFCEATGLSEDMLSHVLAGRKNFAINTLDEALRKIGYTLHIAPLADTQQ
jgi:hypothetical protein